MNKVYIENGGGSYVSMWQALGFQRTNVPAEADVIQFTGGADVSPEYYGEVRHPTTGNNKERDEKCFRLFKYGVGHGIPLAGICRGGQFLNVANGGKMFQDVDGHAIRGTHEAVIQETGKRVQVTSTHHQMMRPNRDKGIVLMIADPSLTTYKTYMSYNEGTFDLPDHEWVACDANEEDDMEAVYYPDTKSLCFQPHPEYYLVDSECFQTYRYFLRNYLDLKV